MINQPTKLMAVIPLMALFLIFPWAFKLSPAEGADLKNMITADKKAPVHIISDNLEADNKAHTITFSGNVVAKRDDATLYADSMTVFLNEKMDTMIKIEAVGNVRVSQKDRFATGDKGEYWDAEQKVILTGNPKVWQGENVVTGETIEFYMKEEKAKAIRGENKRVTAVVIPGKGMSLLGSEVQGQPKAKKEDQALKEEKPVKKEDKAALDKININQASKEELLTKFPGLEEKKAESIVKGRPYEAPIELVKKGILNQKEWELVGDYATVK